MDSSTVLLALRILTWAVGMSLVSALTSVPAMASQPEEGVTIKSQSVSQRFLDVRHRSTHATAINALADWGVSRGCSPERFCPDDTLTRAQMASMISQILPTEPPGQSGFSDVVPGSQHQEAIDRLAAAGIVKGCRTGRFCPNRSVTREQIASVLARGLQLPAPPRSEGFVDLGSSVHASSVYSLVARGAVKGCAPSRFCGKQPVTRAQFASLVYRIAPQKDRVPEPEPLVGGSRFLYSDSDVVRFRRSMSGAGPYFSRGDAGHGGQYSPDDGQDALRLAERFLANPSASYWTQSKLPYSDSSDQPLGEQWQRFMQAAWVYMTVPDHPDHEMLGREVKKLLLTHASNPANDWSNSTNYPLNGVGGHAQNIFWEASFGTRLIKARDMLGREAFTDAENAVFDQWMYGYSNWMAKWLHHRGVGQYLPGRLDRDYSRVNRPEDAHRASYDGGPLIGSMGLTHTNRHAAPASMMSLAANYLEYYGYDGSTRSNPSYGRFSVNELLEHSRLYVEETLRFGVHPEGFQGDFERGDLNYHRTATARQGWLYSINVLSNLVEMADYHAKRGDMSVWDYGTTAGYDGTAGAPNVGGFTEKNLHFYAWSMSRYMNDGWKRTNRGESMVLSHFYHDVIPAAIVSKHVPDDTLLSSAWKRQGQGFPAYGQHPQSQGPWQARYGEGAKMIGLIEHAH